jgi:hypothetical protein
MLNSQDIGDSTSEREYQNVNKQIILRWEISIKKNMNTHFIQMMLALVASIQIEPWYSQFMTSLYV